MRSTVVPPLFAAPSQTPPHEVSPLRLPARSRGPQPSAPTAAGAGSGSRSEGHLGGRMGAASQRRGSLWPSACRLLSLVVAFPLCDYQRTAGQIKSPSKARGYIRGRTAPLPYLTDRSVGIGTWTSASGCRVSSGRFPPPLLIRAGCYSVVVANYSTAFRILSRLHRPACEKVSSLTFPHRAGAKRTTNMIYIKALRGLRAFTVNIRIGAG
jgi:hypothetical protein